MFKSKTKYTWEGWESSGGEDWVFSVKHPCELMGVHAKLIDAHLKDSEKVEYCIYSPRVSSTSTPFGFKSEESSWGLCATDNRFIISKNRHVKNAEPELFSISFGDVLYFNIGRALLLSWFSITYALEKEKRHIDILFASNGRHHFEKALRSCKKYQNAVTTDVFGLESFSAASFIHKIHNKRHAGSLKTLISSGEKCLCAFSCQCLWDKFLEKKSFFRKSEVFYYPRSNATFLLTNKALLLARDSLETGVSNGVDILNMPLVKIKTASVLEEKLNDSTIQKIKISLAAATEDCSIEIPFTCENGHKTILIDALRLLVDNKK
jgi:hypothetical protein